MILTRSIKCLLRISYLILKSSRTVINGCWHRLKSSKSRLWRNTYQNCMHHPAPRTIFVNIVGSLLKTSGHSPRITVAVPQKSSLPIYKHLGIRSRSIPFDNFCVKINAPGNFADRRLLLRTKLGQARQE